MVSVIAGAADHARVLGLDGTTENVPLVGVSEPDGGVRYTFSAAHH